MEAVLARRAGLYAGLASATVDATGPPERVARDAAGALGVLQDF